ncbi:hypothetical protein LY632_03535 [Erythrobacter sp. SDW2]|nr:hypothetical protein LY632_03535 [Erythrobacter sp. SDW2]
MEDVATMGLLWLEYEYPLAAGVVALALLTLAVALLLWARKMIKRLFFRVPKVEGVGRGSP